MKNPLLILLTVSLLPLLAVAQRANPPDDSPRGENLRFYESFKAGDSIPDELEIYTVSGERLSAKQLFKKPYTVLISGCLTCGQFRTTYQEVEAVYNDYKSEDVDFFFIFQTLQHPENDSYIQAFSMEERFLQVEEAKEHYGTSVPWVLDTFDNNWKAYFQGRPNSEIIFDREGRMIHVEPWVRHPNLRNALTELFGAVESPTRVADLDLPNIERHSEGRRTGVIERLKVAGDPIPLRFTPAQSDLTYYAKLRTEVDSALFDAGSGQMYLGLHLDPIYDVHWNNLAEPVMYRLSLPEGVSASPATAKGPLPEVESDMDPREFLVDIDDWTDRSAALGIEIFYLACNKEQGWCKPVTQEYSVSLERAQLAGSAYSRRQPPGGPRRSRPQQR